MRLFFFVRDSILQFHISPFLIIDDIYPSKNDDSQHFWINVKNLEIHFRYPSLTTNLHFVKTTTHIQSSPISLSSQ